MRHRSLPLNSPLQVGLGCRHQGDGGLVGEDARVLQHGLQLLDYREDVCDHPDSTNRVSYLSGANIHSPVDNIPFDFLDKQEKGFPWFVFCEEEEKGRVWDIVDYFFWGELDSGYFVACLLCT